MTLIDWLPTALLALVIWLSRNLIENRLRSSVQHEFDAKLAALNSELRSAEEKLKADLKSKDQVIQALQSASLASLTSRRAATDKRRIEAVDQLWTAQHRLGFAKVAAQWMGALHFRAVAEAAEKKPELRQIFSSIHIPADHGAEAFALAHQARPHVSPLTWAYFSAWQAVVMHAVVQLKMIQGGVNLPDTINTSHVINALKLALPHRSEYIDKYGIDGGFNLLEELELKLLDELREGLSGKADDLESVRHARRIIDEATQPPPIPAELQALGGRVPAP